MGLNCRNNSTLINLPKIGLNACVYDDYEYLGIKLLEIKNLISYLFIIHSNTVINRYAELPEILTPIVFHIHCTISFR